VKVHIINLDPEDDHVSVRDKISWARGSKVVLVWPRHGRPLDRRLDLTVVQRHASRLDLELGLVTFEPEIIAHAEQLNISMFDSLEKLPPGTWSEPTDLMIPHRERSSLAELREARDADSGTLVRLGERGRIIAVGVSIIAVLALAISILPSAKIVMAPTGIPIERNLSIWVDPLPASSSSMVQGQPVSAEISGVKRVETTGRIRLPLAAATGELQFINRTDEEISIPAGTGLRAGEVRFLTSEGADLEPGADSSIILAIEAVEPGISGNVAAGAIDSVEGPLGFLVTASNLEPTRGGRDQVAGAVGVRDMELVRQDLELELLESAGNALVAELNRGYQLIPGSLRVTEVVDERYDIELGEAAESLGLTLVLKIEGLGYSVPLVREAAEQELLSALPKNRMLIPGTLSLKAVDALADWPSMEVLFAVEGALAKTIDRDRLRQFVLGDPKTQAAARLEQLLGLEQAPLIQTTPSWMPWVPWLGMRIDFKWAWENA
jgi:hypothetical protein